MNGRFRDVDLDLLADYVGGALDGTPDEAVVARLIDENPAWRRAYSALAPATEAVRSALAAWGADEIAMPADVADSLAEAISTAGRPESPAGTDRASHRRVEPGRLPLQSGNRRGTIAAGREREVGPRPPGRARRRWSRWTARAAIAAAVAAVTAFGVDHLWRDPGSIQSGSATEERFDAASPPADEATAEPLVAPAPIMPNRIVSSGTDYTRADLAAVPVLRSADSGIEIMSSPETQTLKQLAPGLERMADHRALAACLEAVNAAHAHGPITVTLVDYAAFEGAPALVIAFVDVIGESWAWAVGSDCGRTGSDADSLHRTRVG